MNYETGIRHRDPGSQAGSNAREGVEGNLEPGPAL